MVTLYRLEKDGYGPAQHPWLGFSTTQGNLLGIEDTDAYDHIGLWEEGCEAWFRNRTPEDRFACLSEEGLKAYWTEEFYQECLDAGFELVTVQVREYSLCPNEVQACYRVQDVEDYDADYVPVLEPVEESVLDHMFKWLGKAA